MKREPSTESTIGEPIKPLPLIVIDANTPVPGDRSEYRGRRASPTRMPPVSAPRTAHLESPVDLPVGTRWIPLLIVLAVVLIPIGIVIVLYLASRRPARVPPPLGSRIDLVAPSAPEMSAPTAATTASAPLQRSTVSPAKRAPVARQKAPSMNKKTPAPAPTEVRSRAAPAGLIKNKTVERAQ